MGLVGGNLRLLEEFWVYHHRDRFPKPIFFLCESLLQSEYNDGLKLRG